MICTLFCVQFICTLNNNKVNIILSLIAISISWRTAQESTFPFQNTLLPSLAVIRYVFYLEEQFYHILWRLKLENDQIETRD